MDDQGVGQKTGISRHLSGAVRLYDTRELFSQDSCKL